MENHNQEKRKKNKQNDFKEKLEKNSIKGLLDTEQKTQKVEQKLIKLYDDTYKLIKKEIERSIDAFNLRENLLDTDLNATDHLDVLVNSDLNYDEKIERQNNLLLIMNQNDQSSNIYKEAKTQYNAYSLNYRINRHEDLLNSIKINIITLGIAEEKLTKIHYINVLKNENSNSKLLSKIKSDGFNTVTKYNVEQILKGKWISNKNYSKRIWKNSKQLNKMLEDILEPRILAGKTTDRIASEIDESFNVGKYNAIRLVRTETTHFYNQSDLRMYKELGVKEYKIVATLDNRTSSICKRKDNLIFKVKEAKTGVNFPPFHPNCRTTTAPIIEDEDFKDKNQTRYAKDLVTNKKYYTTAKNYKEYEKENIAIHGKEEMEKAYAKVKNKSNDKKQYNRYRDILRNSEYMPKNLEDFINLKYNDINRYETLKRECKTINNIKKINKYPDRDIKNYYKFKKDGIEMTNHSIETYSERMFNKKNKPNYNYNDIVDIFKKENNYEDINTNRWVKYYNKLVLILDKETNEVISFRYGRGSKKWKKL